MKASHQSPHEDYFRTLCADFAALGFVAPRFTDATATPEQLYKLMRTTSCIGHKTPSLDPEIRTDLGERLARLARTDVTFASHPRAKKLQVCREAEGALATSLDPHQTSEYPSLILTRAGEPVAVTKGSGKPTSYYFVNDDELGLVKDAFGLMEQMLTPKHLPRTAPFYAADIALFGRFNPIRLSLAALPPDARRRSCPGAPDVQLDTGGLQRTVAAMLVSIPRLPFEAIKKAQAVS